MSHQRRVHRGLICAGIVFSMAFVSAARAADGGESVASGKGKVKFDSLLQVWTLNDTTVTSSTAAKSNFRLRRAEIKFSGAVANNTRWFVMIDPAKSLTLSSTGTLSSTNDNKVLQDLGVVFQFAPDAEFIAGQFKIPTTAEGLDPSSELWFPERSRVARTYGDRREPGVMVTYKMGMVKAMAMISNGAGTNVDDTNNSKDLSLRVEATPLEMLKVGAFTNAKDMSYGTAGRWGANARLDIEQLSIRGEAVHATDLGVVNHGWTVDAGYRVGEWFPVARYEQQMAISGSTNAHAMTAGVNYLLHGHSQKIQAAYILLSDMSGGNGGYAVAPGSSGGLLTISFQAAI